MNSATFRLFMAALAAVALCGPANACTKPKGFTALQSQAIAEVNAERAAKGLPALTFNAALGQAAQRHACDNAARKSISHVSSDGGHLDNRLRRTGYQFAVASENTLRGVGDGEAAVEWWMQSPGHKKNILMTRTREAGIGIAQSRAPDSRLHWVLVMAAK